MSNDLIATDTPLTPEQRQLLSILAGMLIPASEEYSLPGADDERIFANILATPQETLAVVTTELKALEDLSMDRHGRTFAALGEEDKAALLTEFGVSHPMFIPTLFGMTLSSYYQDDRVLASLDKEARPPYPEGFEVEQGDWSLLDPVKRRASFYRKDN
jgi:hypothetical protein